MFDPYLHIESYVNNTLSGEELIAFREALKNDIELNAIVKDFDIYGLLADEIINESISSKIKKAQQSQNNIKSSVFNKKTILLFCIICSLLLTITYLFYQKSSSNYGTQLYADYYFSPTDLTRGENLDKAINIDCEKAHAYLELDEIEKAKIALSENLKSTDSSCKAKSYFLLSLIELKEGRYSEAKLYLELILTDNTEDFDDIAAELIHKID